MLATILCLFLSTSQPSTRESVEADLRRLISDLQRQLMALRAENAALKAKLKQVPSDTKQNTPQGDSIAVGMTLEQATQIVGDEPRLITDNGTSRRYAFRALHHVLEGPPPKDRNGVEQKKYILFVNV